MGLLDRGDGPSRHRQHRVRGALKTPGPAWLQFEAEPRAAGGTVLTQTAFFQPHGLAGLAYWYGLYPIHQRIFSGLARAIAQRSESRRP
jgi:hypothetical protein